MWIGEQQHGGHGSQGQQHHSQQGGGGFGGGALGGLTDDAKSALDQALMARIQMAKRVKSPAKRSRAASKLAEVRSGELVTLLDFVRYAVSRFAEAELVFAQAT